MTKAKQDFPLVLLNQIREFKENIRPPFYVHQNEPALLSVFDSRCAEKFHFVVISYGMSGVQPVYSFIRKPTSVFEPGATEQNGEIKGVRDAFVQWQRLCNDYDLAESPYQDEQEKRTEEEIFADLRILDDDADTALFSIPQQLFLTEAIDRIKENIAAADQEIIEPEQKQDLIVSLGVIQHDLSKQTKNGVMRALSHLAAKARTGSLKAGNFILKEIGKEILKEGVKRLLRIDPHAVSNWLQMFGDNIIGFLS